MEDPKSGESYIVSVWSAVYKRVLSVLAVALEPLSIEELMSLGGISADRDYVIDAVDQLSQFLDYVNDRYRLYHATLPEFLTSSSALPE